MKLSTWAEVAGILALVVSLVFVGIEIRNNTAATSAQALLELNVAMNDVMLLQAGRQWRTGRHLKVRRLGY